MNMHLSLEPKQKRRAIAYYRHSAEDKQENSVQIQRDHTHKFITENDVELIHEEADEGKTGLLATRPAFERLLNAWIKNPAAPEFEYVLVYDVSRWGRFQDQNEGAYYEFLCKQYGRKVVYVTHGFPKEDQQLISHLQTSIERYMAADYSRQLSEKVFYGSVKVSEQGFSAGGTACYGMARQLLDEQHKPIGILEKGQHKLVSNQRVTFVPRNDETTKAVKEAFELLVHNWGTPESIATALNAKGIPSANGGLWNRGKVLNILTNETYTGARIYNKTWGRLKQKNRPNPRNEWVIKPNAFPAIVEQDLFAKAQEHLYWLLPAKWRKGIRKVNRVKTFFQQEMGNVFTKYPEVDDVAAFQVFRNMPIIYSVRFFRDAEPNWWFMCTEAQREYDHVLGVSVVLDAKDPLDSFFMIPTADFSENNILLLAKSDPKYASYALPKESVQSELEKLLLKTVQNYTPKVNIRPQPMQLLPAPAA